LSKRKRKISERISDVELQAASGLAQMSRKKLKKAVKKVSSFGVQRVPSAFDRSHRGSRQPERFLLLASVEI
jgi:hypothetical protein